MEYVKAKPRKKVNGLTGTVNVLAMSPVIIKGVVVEENDNSITISYARPRAQRRVLTTIFLSDPNILFIERGSDPKNGEAYIKVCMSKIGRQIIAKHTGIVANNNHGYLVTKLSASDQEEGNVFIPYSHGEMDVDDEIANAERRIRRLDKEPPPEKKPAAKPAVGKVKKSTASDEWEA